MLEGPLSSLRQFLTTESPLKMMKSAFYVVLKIFEFLSMTSQAGQQIITIHIIVQFFRK